MIKDLKVVPSDVLAVLGALHDEINHLEGDRLNSKEGFKTYSRLHNLIDKLATLSETGDRFIPDIVNGEFAGPEQVVERLGNTQLALEYAYRLALHALGEDIHREGLLDTPKRVAKMMMELTSGMREDPKKHLETGFEEDNHKELVLVKDTPFYSMCEHHMAIIIGKAHIAYIPNGRVTGLSKLARLVEGYARRLQIQERMTSQIADAIMDVLKPEGCAVLIDAEHLCMSARGVKKPGTSTTTSAMRGSFLTDSSLKQEFLMLVK